jgi:hypothetical protein
MLMAGENRVLKEIVRPYREVVTGRWGEQDNENLHSLYA